MPSDLKETIKVPIFKTQSLTPLTGLPSYRYSTQSGTKGNQENR